MATTCENYGVFNGSACSCPVGFGGSTCSQPGCGGTIFQGASRPLAPLPSGSNSFVNLTAAGCSCEDGWTGVGCNVCQTADACSNGLSQSGAQFSASTPPGALQSTLNNTMTCNTLPQVYAVGLMSCAVQNPTLQTLYPLQTTLNIQRTLNPSFTPLPNITGYGTNGTIYAQLFYAGEEQFYCQANSCTQDLSQGDGSSTWNCNNLQCNCLSNATFCGGVPLTNLTNTLDDLTGQLSVSCQAPVNGTVNCAFKQATINSVFGSEGLALNGCSFGECVTQSVIDSVSSNATGSNVSNATNHGASLSGGVIAGLAVVGGLIGLALLFLIYGWIVQRKARAAGFTSIGQTGGKAVQWTSISYFVRNPSTRGFFGGFTKASMANLSEQKVILDNVSGRVEPGHIMAVLGPSGAGKTTLIEILAGKHKSGVTTGSVAFPSAILSPAGDSSPQIGFVPQQDVLPPMLTVHEAILFAARLRLPESIPESEKLARVDDVIEKLGLSSVRGMRIGNGEKRGISGGEMRRVSIGLELVAKPDVLILDEPTSGLDSVSAAKVAGVLHELAHDQESPTAVIASIHQPSSQLYHKFDQILLLSHGRALYSGPGGSAPATYFSTRGIRCPENYNIADYLLEIASDPPVGLFQTQDGGNASNEISHASTNDLASGKEHREDVLNSSEKGLGQVQYQNGGVAENTGLMKRMRSGPKYAATFLTQLEVLSGREWKILRRDFSLFFTHTAVAAVLGVFCGGLYFHTGITIAGFQSRIGCLFFQGALIAFSSLSALYHVVEIRPLFLRERSASYYSPTAWLLSRFIFDVIPLRVFPTIIVSTITYWMAGLAHDATHFFKFLFVLVLYTLAMTLFNFLLACLFSNGGIAILLSALSALFQMTFAGFFVHLNDIPPVLRWLQWICPLKHTLEALSVNEVGSGLMIEDTLQGVPVSLSASLIMNILFDFGPNNYYRDVLILFAFIAGFGLGVIGVVWLRVRERR